MKKRLEPELPFSFQFFVFFKKKSLKKDNFYPVFNIRKQQIYRIHENEKKRLYSERVLDIEHGTFTPLVFTTTGGMGKECLKYHSRLAQLIAIKKGEQYAKTISWIRTRTSFALLRSALVCLRGSRTRRVPCDIKNVDIDVEVAEGAIKSDY